MRIEVLEAFGEQQGAKSVCFHPFGVPHPDTKHKHKHILETGVDLRVETAEWAIKIGAARPVQEPAAKGPLPPAPGKPETPAIKPAVKPENKTEEREP